MPVATLESKANRGSVETALSEFQSGTAPTSIEQVDSTKTGPNRMVITVVYTV